MKRRERYQRGSVVLVGRTWYFRYREIDIDGKVTRPAEAFGTKDQYTTKAKAEKAADILRQRVNEKAMVVHFRNLCDQYQLKGFPSRASTGSSYAANLRRLRSAWGNTRLDFMASPQGIMQIETWFRTLETLPHHRSGTGGGQPLSLKTRENIKSLMHHMFMLAIKWGFLSLQRNPIDLIDLRHLPVSVRAKRKRPKLSLDHYAKLLRDPELPECVKVMIELAANTGMRGSEFLGLQWSDIDYTQGLFWIRRSVYGPHVDDTKTINSAGSYPMHPDVAQLMRYWQQVAPKVNDWVFGSPLTGRPYNRHALQKHHLAPAGKRVGLERLGWHALRHFYRGCQRDLQLPLEHQMMLMRHSRLATTMEYDRLDGTHRAEEVRPYNAKIVEMLSTGKRKIA